MDEWYINPEGEFQHPVGVIVPVSELRVGAWMQHKDKGTLWVMRIPRDREQGFHGMVNTDST